MSTAYTILLGRRSGERHWSSLPGIRLAAACGLGIVAGLLLPVTLEIWLVVAVCCAMLALLVKSNALTNVLVHLVVLAAMAAWFLVWQQPAPADDVGRWATEEPSPVVLEVEVISPVERRPNPLLRIRSSPTIEPYQSIAEMRVVAVRDGDSFVPRAGIVRATIQGDATSFLVGDRAIAYGTLQQIREPTNPGEADLRKIYATRGIGARLSIDSIDQLQLSESGLPGPLRMLSWLSARGDQVLHRYVGETKGDLASALVLGRRASVDSNLRDLLVETGTVHLLSVSGLHLAMVAWLAKVLMSMTNWPRGLQLFFILFVCLFFAALTGARPPVMRASFLVMAILLASWSGKVPLTINTLALAATALMILNPNNLLQTGTQLSFVAVTTLVMAGRQVVDRGRNEIALDRLIEARRSWIGHRTTWFFRVVWRTVVVSFWVWAITAPLVWYAYNILAPVSVISNVLVIPLLGIALTLGMLTAAIGIVAGPVAIPIGYACSTCLSLILMVVEACASIPGAFFWLPAPPTWWVLVFYAGLFLPVLLARIRWIPNFKPSVYYVAWFAIWITLAIPISRRGEDDTYDQLCLTFIDVGHGTSVLIELPDGRGNWLYDAGRLGDPTWSISPIEDTLWHYGIRQLDGLVVSHADADHYNAIPDLLRRFSVSQIYLPPGMIDDPQVGLEPVRVAISNGRVPVTEISDSDQLADSSGDAWCSVLHPPLRRLLGSDNANSVVLQIDWAGKSTLLPGDLEIPGTENLLQHERPAPGGLLMSPHHGSLQQDVRPLLDWMRPSVVVVSGGRRADRDEVRQQQSQNGADCYITASEGAIRIEISKQGDLKARHWVVDRWVD